MDEHKNFTLGQKVVVRRTSADEYRARIVGVATRNIVDIYIIEIVDSIPYYKWTHTVMPESCLDAEEWED